MGKRHFPQSILISISLAILLAAAFSGCSSGGGNDEGAADSSIAENEMPDADGNGTDSESRRKTIPLIVATRDATKSDAMQDTILVYEDGEIRRVIDFDKSLKDAVENDDLNEVEVQFETHRQYPTQASVSAEDLGKIRDCLSAERGATQNLPSDDGYDWCIFAISDEEIVRISTSGNLSDLPQESAETIKEILQRYWVQS